MVATSATAPELHLRPLLVKAKTMAITTVLLSGKLRQTLPAGLGMVSMASARSTLRPTKRQHRARPT